MNWLSVLNGKDSSENVDKFGKIVKKTMDKISPEEKVKISTKHRYIEPWMTQGLEKSRKKKADLYKRLLTKDSTDIDRERYQEYQNYYNKLKR